MIYYIFSIAFLIDGVMMLDFIHGNYPKSKIRNILFWTVTITTITTSLAIIFEKFNISLILSGIIEYIYTYKYRKKENISTFYPYSAEGYLVGTILISLGIVKGFSNGFFW